MLIYELRYYKQNKECALHILAKLVLLLTAQLRSNTYRLRVMRNLAERFYLIGIPYQIKTQVQHNAIPG